MECLDGFVAGALLRRLRPDDRNNAAPVCTSFRGAVLFVDISGYTTLAEALCDKGPDGIEQLAEILDVAFRDHVRSVDETGGEIACFAGDAFIAYWPADDGDASRALRRAHDCALRLHAASRLSVPPASVFPSTAPPLHIGVSAGEIWAAHLGAEERWQLLLAGRAVRDACAAAARATAGETVIAGDAGSMAEPLSESSAATRTATPDGGTSRTLDPHIHVPRRVHDYASEGYSAWIPQRRTICALFVRIDGLDEAADDALTSHQVVVTSLHVAIRPYTGSTGTLLLDDKGLVFVVCLGMPYDTHADDTMRAVRAGLAIRGELSRLGLDCGGGVAAGAGLSMPIGGPQRRQYWAIGRFTHVAARLMEAAGSGLLCTEHVADRVRRAVSLSPERPLAVKGVPWPLRVFRVLDAATLHDQADVIYGREDEQAVLTGHLDTFQRGRGAVVWMVGEAGVGKTALVHYLREEAAHRGITCLTGAAASVEIADAYGAWRPLFGAMLGDPASMASTQEERRERVRALRHPQLAPLINAVLPGFLDEPAMLQTLSGQARADATSTLLSEVFGAHATSRFVLVLEDCHWIDSASWRLVLRIAQDYPEALVVLTSRPPTAEANELSGLRRLDRFAEMKLSPLRQSAIGSLVHSVLGGAATAELVDEIAHRARGNPLFAREYALLLTTALPEHRPGTAPTSRQADSSVASMPAEVERLIASRLDALSLPEELALKAASVIGDTFSLDLITRVYPGNLDRERLDAVLAGLTERQLIAPVVGEPHRFHFQHALIREVAYRQLTRDRRCELHRRVAEALERDYERDLRPHFGTLAHHWLQAEEERSTITYADRAAAQALAAGAFEEAEQLLTTCVRLADKGAAAIPDRIRWHRQLADARHGMGQIESRGAAARQALRLAEVPRSHTALGLMAQAGARLCDLGFWSVGLRSSPVGEKSQMLDLARAYRHSAEVCYFNADMIGMICDSVSSVVCASPFGPSPVLAGASAELGGILSIAGMRRVGERIVEHAIALAEAADDQATQAHAHMVSCLYYVGICEWESAEKSARRCQELCEPIEDRVTWTNAQAVRFWMSHYRCHEAAAYDAAISLRDRASETGNRQHRAWASRFLALCALRNGNPAAAVLHLEAALESLGETAALNERIPTLGLLALAELQRGEVWAARAKAKEGLAQVRDRKRPIGHATLEGYSALVTVALDRWRTEDVPEWKDHVRRCLTVLNRYQKSLPVGEPRYHLHRGDYLRLSGSPAAARRSYRRGEASAVRLGMPWEAKRCGEAIEELAGGP